MNSPSVFCFLLLATSLSTALAAIPSPPESLITRSGDQSIILHWDRSKASNLAGYRVYKSPTKDGPFHLQNRALLLSPGFCDSSTNVLNGQTNFYRVTAVTTDTAESEPSATIGVASHAFANDNEFLDYIQAANFDYFWYLANPDNGLIPDRSSPKSLCSIAAVGFGLSALCIGVDHGWITRTQASSRVLTTLQTFLSGPQEANVTGTIGYKGWFYHFLDMKTALRAKSELSSIDTTLLLCGMLHAREYFERPSTEEESIRKTVNAILARIDWNWMARNTNVVSMGWHPPDKFIESDWIGYNEAMALLILGMGVATNALPASAWERWTQSYTWVTNHGQAYVPFPPLFVHQYSHCWIDFRDISDSWMKQHKLTYFENSRRATLAQRQYCIANPLKHAGYGSNVWGLTACDAPNGYAAHGALPVDNDDGTIAPTAPGGSIPFTPEYSITALRAIYDKYRNEMWTAFGYRDGFNPDKSWFASDTLGIDQGPIVLMIENYRTQRVWKLFMRCEEIQRGIKLAGFSPAPASARRN